MKRTQRRTYYVFYFLLVSTTLLLTACPDAGQEQALTQIQTQLSVLSNETRESFVASEEDRVSLYQKLNEDVTLLKQNQAAASATNDDLQTAIIAIEAKIDEYNTRMTLLDEQLGLVETSLTERITSLSEQVSELGRETTIAPGPARTPTPRPTTTPPPVSPLTPDEPTSEEQVDSEASQFYHTSYTAYMNGDYDTAIAGFEKFLETYGETELADMAQYWIAESFFGLGEYETALNEYDRLIGEYPESDKVADAYLNKAVTYIQLDRQIEAISHLKYVVNRFPNTAAAQQAAERLRAMGE